MRVENIECQIAQGQMTRYLSGEALGADVAAELKAHIAACPECAEVLESKRSVLRAMLGSNAVVGLDEPEVQPEPSEASTNPRRNALPLINLLRNRAGGADPGPSRTGLATAGAKRSWQRAALYAAALALVAIGMSQVLNDPTKLFGERASTTNSLTPPENITPPTASPSSPPANGSDSAADPAVPSIASSAAKTGEATLAANFPSSVGGKAAAPAASKPAAAPPAVETAQAPKPASKPKVAVTTKQPIRTATRPPRSARQTGARRASGGGSIRVYGPDGRPISQ